MFSEPLLLKCKSVIFDSVSHRASLRLERVAASHRISTVTFRVSSRIYDIYVTVVVKGLLTFSVEAFQIYSTGLFIQNSVT